ncbi:hypothetical protein [Alteromonas macleodii]|uniref:Uncharacterized protein n=1 Tax=Alteromonas macleodii TaxID=28108 RepID=A0AB36FL05_ALTMA|nr:hypothetical protein [Alteromonas macleodii]OES23918.1 hypothetical protein BFV94_4966 [Alteromonas macleodii]OES24096.1 hypothetical protein BFV93_4849 [Alteromonas macleodii]OES25023.1 hypothetical protein BFV95_4491 [Alteromonas macleodii]OES38709.1 hypothetical protein BFV96_4820 [Alteromonas macleodii]
MERITWTGDNQIEISHFLGHENFWHKDGELLVETDDDGMMRIPKHGLLLKSDSGEVYQPLSQYHYDAEICGDPDDIEKALDTIESRINTRLNCPSGDRTAALDAIALLRFWSMPLQNAAESLGFDDYLGAFIRTEFDTPQCEQSWEVGFLKAHQVDRSKHDVSINHATLLLAQRQ